MHCQLPKNGSQNCKTPADVSRRDFLGLVIKGGLLATLAGMVLPALTYLWPVTHRGPAGGQTDVGAADEIPVGSGKKVSVEGSAVIIVRTPQGFKAFSAVCPHLGCLVAWEEARHVIVCPCHAGTFDTDGRVVSGPPPRGLAPREVSVVGGRIMVKSG